MDKNLQSKTSNTQKHILRIFFSFTFFTLCMLTTQDSYAAADPATLESVKQEVVDLNKNIPRKLDSETEISRVYLSNDTVTYEYKLLDEEVSKLDTNKFQDVVKKALVNDLCKDAGIKSRLDQGINFSFNYNDKNGATISDVLVTKDDCPK